MKLKTSYIEHPGLLSLKCVVQFDLMHLAERKIPISCLLHSIKSELYKGNGRRATFIKDAQPHILVKNSNGPHVFLTNFGKAISSLSNHLDFQIDQHISKRSHKTAEHKIHKTVPRRRWPIQVLIYKDDMNLHWMVG